jgi:hypoxanthine phosphoribosyltransferase
MDSNNKPHVTINGLEFVKFIDHEDLSQTIKNIAIAIKNDYNGELPVFVVLLNGAFVFAADLLRSIDSSIETFFVKISSYHDLESTGEVKIEKNNLHQLSGRKILLIEDIIDTGTTMNYLLKYLTEIGVCDVEICSLLVKPGKLKYPVNIKYSGYHIGDEFVVGFGLDYNEQGRNLRHIYQLSSAQ